MINKTKYFNLTFAAITIMSLWSCSDKDMGIPEEDRIPEGMERISFMLPDYSDNVAQFGTRAFNTAEEGYMSNLYVIAIKYSDFIYNEDGSKASENPLSEENQKVYTYSLNPVGVRFEVGATSYKLFNVTLYPGKYKFAVVSNFDLYLDRATKISEFTEEGQLRTLKLNFTEDTPLAPLHLPMVCLPPNIQWSDDNDNHKDSEGKYIKQSVENVENNLVPVEKGKNTQIYADMSFVCSKVRYTILFDKTPNGISKAFGSSWIRFNVDDKLKPSATYVRRQTLLEPENPENKTDTPQGADGNDTQNPFVGHLDDAAAVGWWDMSIDRFKWHSQGADYPLSPKSELEAWTGETSDWISQEQKVWQGVVYLPENNDTEIQKTILRFPYHTRINDLDDTPEVEAPNPKEIVLFGDGQKKFEGLDGDNYSGTPGTYKGLERNYFYDVVAKVVNPDVDGMDIRVFVSILPWHEIDQDLTNDDNFQNQENFAPTTPSSPSND